MGVHEFPVLNPASHLPPHIISLDLPREPALDSLTRISIQFSSVAQSCPTLCDPMNHSMSGLLVHFQHLEFTQTNVH